MKKLAMSLAVAGLMLAVSSMAQAALITIGTANYGEASYKLIYDADSPSGPITWLDYTDWGSGGGDWQTSVDWASGLGSSLTVNLDSGYTTAIDWTTGWRLPATVDGLDVQGTDGTTTGGYNVTSSEMGHLYYEELGNLSTLDGGTLTNTGDFANLYQWDSYWSGTEYASTGNVNAWMFNMSTGDQWQGSKSLWEASLAVRPGTVTPEPATLCLLGIGALALLRRRKRRV